MKNEHEVEYQMPRSMYRSIVDTQKGEDKKLTPKDYVIKVINEEFGLRGTVVNLFIME